MRVLGALSLSGLHTLTAPRPAPDLDRGMRRPGALVASILLPPPARQTDADRAGGRADNQAVCCHDLARAGLRAAPGANMVGPHPAGGRRARLDADYEAPSHSPPPGMRLSPRTGLELDAFELSAPAAVCRAMAPNGWRVSGE